MKELIASVKREYLVDLASQGKRVDGRALDQYREVSIERGIIGTAQGSALVKLGNTQVMVGVKLEKGEPFPDTPTSGILVVNAELLPLASPTFEPGPPNENAIELARVVDRTIRESQMIDLEKLCIKEGEEVWAVFIDIYVLDHDGNLIDASVLASVAALYDVKPPAAEEWTLPEFPLRAKPVAVTVVKLNGVMMVDAGLEEENTADVRLTISTLENGDICAMQKGGSGFFQREELEKAYELARRCGEELRKKL
ncbi:MAG: exosome complex protein Rrp42 [Candidatus Hadarchaeales archaeon]